MSVPAAHVQVEHCRVEAWYGFVSDAFPDAARVSAALEWLSPDDRARYLRFRRDAERQLFLLGRVMTRAAVGRVLGVPPTAWAWQVGRNGKPQIGNEQGPVSFNLAHTSDLVVCAVGLGVEVGIDVEDLEGAPIDDAVQRVCSPRERADIDGQPPERRRQRALSYWTLKEAYLKALGVGLTDAVTRVEFELDRDPISLRASPFTVDQTVQWHVRLGTVADRYLVALAATGSLGTSAVVRPFPAQLLPA